jgi:hypothetical protein
MLNVDRKFRNIEFNRPFRLQCLRHARTDLAIGPTTHTCKSYATVQTIPKIFATCNRFQKNVKYRIGKVQVANPNIAMLDRQHIVDLFAIRSCVISITL